MTEICFMRRRWLVYGRKSRVSNRVTWASFTFLDDIQILAKGKQLVYDDDLLKNAHVICEPLERKNDRWIIFVILITLAVAPLSSIVTWNVKLGFLQLFIQWFGGSASQWQHAGSLIFHCSMWDLSNPGIEPWSPALQADSLLAEHQGSSNGFIKKYFYFSLLFFEAGRVEWVNYFNGWANVWEGLALHQGPFTGLTDTPMTTPNLQRVSLILKMHHNHGPHCSCFHRLHRAARLKKQKRTQMCWPDLE